MYVFSPFFRAITSEEATDFVKYPALWALALNAGQALPDV
jgi:hypothetical protein